MEKIVCVLKVKKIIGTKNCHDFDVEDRFVGSVEETICYLLQKYADNNKFLSLPTYMTIGMIETAKKLDEKLKR